LEIGLGAALGSAGALAGVLVADLAGADSLAMSVGPMKMVAMAMRGDARKVFCMGMNGNDSRKIREWMGNSSIGCKNQHALIIIVHKKTTAKSTF
jgi:hypothetical protein